MIAPVFVDTNVLVYARDPSAGAKHTTAREWLVHLWQTRRGRLSFQVLNEYYVVATGKLRPGVRREDARSDVSDLLAWQPVPLDGDVVATAWDIQDRFALSYWDALIVAAAHVTSCKYLLTEDMQHGQDIDGIKILSPFRAAPAEAA